MPHLLLNLDALVRNELTASGECVLLRTLLAGKGSLSLKEIHFQWSTIAVSGQCVVRWFGATFPESVMSTVAVQLDKNKYLQRG